MKMRHLAGLALPVSIALVLAGCGGSSGGTGGTGGPSPSTGQGLASSDINPHPVSDLKDGGTIVWSIDQFGPQWNTNQVNGNETSMANVAGALMPSPTETDDKGNISYNPDYWLSVKLINTNPQTVEYKLNPKAKWSDGKPITVADFQAEWKALNGKNKKFDVVSTTGYEDIKSVEQGTDPYDVIVTFAKKYAEWQPLFNALYPASVNSDPNKFDNAYLGHYPITAGPFKFDHFDKSAQTVTVVRDPNWWGAKPHLDKIVFKTLESTAADQAFANGEIDYDYLITPNAAEYKLAKSNPNGTVRVAGGPDQRHFTFHAGGILADLKVRQAIAMGTNRAAIAKSDLTGLPVKSLDTLDNHIFVNTQAGYQDNTGDLGKYNPDGARQLLDSDGWTLPSGGKFRQKNGKTLEVRFTIPAEVASSKNESELMQAMMADIGVKLKIVTVPANPFFDKYVLPGNFDITPFSWIGTPFPGGGAKSIYVCHGGQNWTNTCNPQIDKDFNQALASTDINTYRTKLNDADKLIWAEVHSLFLYQRPQMNGVKNGIANLGSFGLGTIDYTKIGYLKNS